MRRRTGLLLAALAVAASAAATPVQAAPRCNLLVDPRGDEDPLKDPALDIVSADVASNARELTVAIRLADLTNPALTSPAGGSYSYILHIGEADLEFVAELNAGAAPAYSLRKLMITRSGNAQVVQPEPLPAKVRGVVDVARDEVRMTVALRDLASFGATRKGAFVWDMQTISWRAAQAGGERFISATDHARTKNPKDSYKLGTPSCLAVGK